MSISILEVYKLGFYIEFNDEVYFFGAKQNDDES